MMTRTKIRYEIQQDNANNWRVIRTGPDGVRRAWDNPPCRTQTEARKVIRDALKVDQHTMRFSRRSAWLSGSES